MTLRRPAGRGRSDPARAGGSRGTRRSAVDRPAPRCRGILPTRAGRRERHPTPKRGPDPVPVPTPVSDPSTPRNPAPGPAMWRNPTGRRPTAIGSRPRRRAGRNDARPGPTPGHDLARRPIAERGERRSTDHGRVGRAGVGQASTAGSDGRRPGGGRRRERPTDPTGGVRRPAKSRAASRPAAAGRAPSGSLRAPGPGVTARTVPSGDNRPGRDVTGHPVGGERPGRSARAAGPVAEAARVGGVPATPTRGRPRWSVSSRVGGSFVRRSPIRGASSPGGRRPAGPAKAGGDRPGPSSNGGAGGRAGRRRDAERRNPAAYPRRHASVTDRQERATARAKRSSRCAPRPTGRSPAAPGPDNPAPRDGGPTPGRPDPAHAPLEAGHPGPNRAGRPAGRGAGRRVGPAATRRRPRCGTCRPGPTGRRPLRTTDRRRKTRAGQAAVRPGGRSDGRSRTEPDHRTEREQNPTDPRPGGRRRRGGRRRPAQGHPHRMPGFRAVRQNRAWRARRPTPPGRGPVPARGW